MLDEAPAKSEAVVHPLDRLDDAFPARRPVRFELLEHGLDFRQERTNTRRYVRGLDDIERRDGRGVLQQGVRFRLTHLISILQI